jgi:catechol 2,3-dioxygenase-like lactoylglutathione lyase family enzyme
MCRITDPEKSRAFYEALGFTFAGDFDIVRDGELEATTTSSRSANRNPCSS